MTHLSDSTETIAAWFAGRLPDDWFTAPPDVILDRDEILVVGALPEPETPAGADEAARTTALEARIDGFREETRRQRMRIADEAQRRFRRKVSWGATCGEMRRLFTTAAVPMMTRLRLDERRVLDTLVAAGVARSRAHALAWCVRLVAKNQDRWLADLQDAFAHVERVRAQGPVADV